MRSLFTRYTGVETDLLERLRKMDSATWTQAIRQYQPGILHACRIRLRNHSDAEDVCSEVFLRAVSQIARFRGDSSFKTWLHTIAHNLCMTHLATASRRRYRSIDELSDRDTRSDLPADDSPSADQLLEGAEIRSAFDQAMRALDPELANAFYLREIEEFSYEEIARVTGTAINTVKTRIFRARSQLRGLLVEHRK
jgi:RNA polymerase sigma-70 factor, ECF subfamily